MQDENNNNNNDIRILSIDLFLIFRSKIGKRMN
jgi:hypothetical protein